MSATTILKAIIDLDTAKARAELEAFRQRLAAFANTSGLGKHGASVRDVAGEYSKLSAQLLAVKSATAVLTAAVAGAVPVLGQMAVTVGAAFGTALATANVAAMSKELESLHRSTDISRQSLQEWRLAARFEGIGASLNEFGDMSGVFVDIGEAVAKLGTKEGEEFAATLSQIGLSADDLRGKKADEALLLIGQALDKSGLTGKQQENILAGISDDAGKLLPLLKSNSAALNEIKLYASAVGAIQSDAQLDAMRQTNRELSFFKVGVEGIQAQLAAVGSNVINTLGPNIRQLFIDARVPLQAWGVEVDATLTKFKADLDSGGWATAFSKMFQGAYPTLHQFVSSAADFGRGYGQSFVAPMLEELKAAYAGIGSSLAGAGGAEALGRSMGEAMQPVIAIVHNVVGAVRLLIDNWDTLKTVASYTPVGFVVAHWDSVVAVFTSVGNGIRSVAETFGLLNPATTGGASGVQVFLAALGGLLAASASTRLALGLVGAAVSTFAFALGPLSAGLGVAATAMGVVGRALQVVGLVAAANPIGATIVAIAAGAALLYANWERISGWWSGLWGGLSSTASSTWQSIKSTVGDTTVGQGIIAAWSDASGGLKAVWADINGAAKAVWADIAPAASTGLKAVQSVNSAAAGVLATVWGNAWAGVKSVTSASIAALLPIAKAGWDGIKQDAATIGGAIKVVISTIWDGIKLIFSGWWQAVKVIFSTGWEGLRTAAKAGLQALQGDFSGAWDTIKRGVSGFVADVLTHFRRVATDFSGIGKDMLAGLARGIADGAAAAVSKAKAVAGDVYQGVKDFFVIRSPSRLMQGLGVEVSAGLAVGITDAGGKAIEAAASVSISITDEFNKLAGSVNDALTGAFMSLDFSNLGSSLSNIFKQQVIQPMLSSALQPLSSGIASLFGGLKNSIGAALGGGGSGGILGSITSALGLGGGSGGGGLLGSITSGLGSLFGGGGSVTGALSGMGSALSGFASALGPVGIAAGAIAALSSIIGKPQGNVVFGQGMAAGQQLTGQGGHGGQGHYRESVFGLLGATSDSNKIGREKDFVPKFHLMMDQMVALDKMIATALPRSLNDIKAALQGVTQSGFSTSDMLKSRYTAVFSALPAELQAAMQGGKNLMAGSADEIVARFGLMAAAAQSVVPALSQLGLNTGKTKDSAIAAALGLADLMGGIDKVKESAALYHQEFFSDEERKAQALRKAAADVAGFNKSLGLSGEAAVNSHVEFRRYVDSLDLTTLAGREAYAAAMAVAGSMDAVADAHKAQILNLQQALPSLENLNLKLGNTVPSATNAVNGLAALMGGIDKLTQASNTYYDKFFTAKEKEQRSLANAAADVAGFNKSLGLSGEAAIDTREEFRKYVDGLSLQTQAGREAYAQAMQIVGSMDAIATTGKSLDSVIGSLPKPLYAKALAMATLGDAVDKAANGSSESLGDVNKSLTDLGSAAGKTARAIKGFVDKTLKAAGLLGAPNTATNTTNGGAGGADGSHAGGLDYVPKDGYRAILHKGEMVLTAPQAASYRGGGAQMAVSVQPQLQIIVNNNSASANVRVERGTNAAGNMTATLTIEDIEDRLFDRARRGKGLGDPKWGKR